MCYFSKQVIDVFGRIYKNASALVSPKVRFQFDGSRVKKHPEVGETGINITA